MKVQNAQKIPIRNLRAVEPSFSKEEQQESLNWAYKADSLSNYSISTVPEETEEQHRIYEQLYDLQHQLIARIYIVCEVALTLHQKKVLTLWLQGRTMDQIGVILQVNYTAINHCLMGISVSKISTPTTHYGGLFRKLKRVMKKDIEVQQVLENIRQLRNELEYQEPQLIGLKVPN